jgi:hypothetical protein
MRSPFRGRPARLVVFSHALLANEQNEVLQSLTALPFNLKIYQHVHYVIQPTLFIRRSALEREPHFVREDLDYVMDRDLIIRLARGSRFIRAPGVAAIDRHQRDRKVLRQGFLVEAAAEASAHGVSRDIGGFILRRAVLLIARLAGAWVVLTLPRRLDPPITLHIPGLADRLRLQLVTQRRKMPF